MSHNYECNREAKAVLCFQFSQLQVVVLQSDQQDQADNQSGKTGHPQTPQRSLAHISLLAQTRGPVWHAGCRREWEGRELERYRNVSPEQTPSPRTARRMPNAPVSVSKPPPWGHGQLELCLTNSRCKKQSSRESFSQPACTWANWVHFLYSSGQSKVALSLNSSGHCIKW